MHQPSRHQQAQTATAGSRQNRHGKHTRETKANKQLKLTLTTRKCSCILAAKNCSWYIALERVAGRVDICVGCWEGTVPTELETRRQAARAKRSQRGSAQTAEQIATQTTTAAAAADDRGKPDSQARGPRKATNLQLAGRLDVLRHTPVAAHQKHSVSMLNAVSESTPQRAKQMPPARGQRDGSAQSKQDIRRTTRIGSARRLGG
jgi:hypothetical protein